MASLEVGFTGSEIAITAYTVLFTTQMTGERPCAASRSASGPSEPRSRLRSRACRSEMTSMMRRSTVPRTPLPSIAANFSTGRSETCLSCAALRIACARGCSERCSTDAAHLSTSAGLIGVPSGFLAVTMCVTAGRPSVIVPVLSSSTMRTFASRSSASPLRMRMPYSAAFPVPTRIAVGVASPNAQGQAMIKTLTNATVANTTARASGGGPKSNQPTKAAMASAMTIGTNTPATRSASFWIGALVACASSTSCTIWPSAVSLPTRVTRKVTLPVVLSVPPITSSPGFFATGIGSPVIIDSFTADAPSVTTPSTGIFSPGLMMTRSPTTTASTGISVS